MGEADASVPRVVTPVAGIAKAALIMVTAGVVKTTAWPGVGSAGEEVLTLAIPEAWAGFGIVVKPG